MQKFTVVKNRENPYVMLFKEPLSDPNISWRAKGIWAYLLSKPDRWCVTEADLMNKGKEGRDAIRKALKELEAAGYIHRSRTRDPLSKRFTPYDYDVYEEPIEPEDIHKSTGKSSNY